MAHSKDVSRWLEFFKKLFAWGFVASGFIVLSHIVYINMFPRWGIPPDVPAQASLSNLRTALEAYYADYQRFPQTNELPSLPFEGGVTASFVTSRDGQHYCAMAFHREGNNYILVFSESSEMWLIPFSKQGLVPATSLL